MKAYRVSVNLKLGLISFAILIAVASLWYTTRLVDRLKERETSVVQLWAKALEEIPKAPQTGANTPYPADLDEIASVLQGVSQLPGVKAAVSPEDFERYAQALRWARNVPAPRVINFIQEAILFPDLVGEIPAIVVDSASGQPVQWWNTGSAATTFADLTEAEAAAQTQHLLEQVPEMALLHDPIPIVVTFPGTADYTAIRFVQYLYYGESKLVQGLQSFPLVQLLFVSLFVLVGYIGFSYIRRSEQSSLWVGMAKEAAHQLGTPISSLMGWLEYMRMRDGERKDSIHEETYVEIEKDIERLTRVASRFSDIGSLPKLELQPIGPVIENTTDYMRRRLPQGGTFIRLNVVTEPGLEAPLNAELFEWVIENLLKNALDAIESERGRIDVMTSAVDKKIRIDVRDTGKGVDRRNWKNIFRPGYSTKKRGWGLGLSLAKRIVEDYHGGTLVLAQSKLGQGTTFRIEIPAG